jgi:hypothetical protein
LLRRAIQQLLLYPFGLTSLHPIQRLILRRLSLSLNPVNGLILNTVDRLLLRSVRGLLLGAVRGLFLCLLHRTLYHLPRGLFLHPLPGLLLCLFRSLFPGPLGSPFLGLPDLSFKRILDGIWHQLCLRHRSQSK